MTTRPAAQRSAGTSDSFLLVDFQDNPTQAILISAAVNAVRLSLCGYCNGRMLWMDNRIVWPQVGGAEPANPDMSDEARADYRQAAGIVYQSPLGAAALLRLAIQSLCKEQGEPWKKISTDIGSFVAQGLHPHVQKAMDAFRVIGNEAVHPGGMDLGDDRKTASKLFGLVDLIVEEMVSRKKPLRAAHDARPADKLKGIEDRDKKVVTAANSLEPPAES